MHSWRSSIKVKYCQTELPPRPVVTCDGVGKFARTVKPSFTSTRWRTHSVMVSSIQRVIIIDLCLVCHYGSSGDMPGLVIMLIVPYKGLGYTCLLNMWLRNLLFTFSPFYQFPFFFIHRVYPVAILLASSLFKFVLYCPFLFFIVQLRVEHHINSNFQFYMICDSFTSLYSTKRVTQM